MKILFGGCLADGVWCFEVANDPAQAAGVKPMIGGWFQPIIPGRMAHRQYLMSGTLNTHVTHVS